MSGTLALYKDVRTGMIVVWAVEIYTGAAISGGDGHSADPTLKIESEFDPGLLLGQHLMLGGREGLLRSIYTETCD